MIHPILVRTARVLFPSISRSTTSATARHICTPKPKTVRCSISASSFASRARAFSTRVGVRPQVQEGVMAKGLGGGLGQVRGMKVRSSVKKLCEGCKVR
ncbi:hypothetical protein WAI453_004402 [Rhynchosporium graminicola]